MRPHSPRQVVQGALSDPPRVTSPPTEDGFAMVEVIVSAVLLVVMAMATFSLLDKSGQATGLNRARGVASNLAHADLNRMRQMSFAGVSAFHQVSAPKLVDGITYTVESRADWTADGGQVLTCTTSDGSQGAQYLRISSAVSWSAMADAKPVVAETIITPKARDLDPTAGSLAFKVQDSAGRPVPGVNVHADGETLVTDDSGCVIFGRLPAGSVQVTYAKAGFVDRLGNGTGVYDAQIVAGQTAVKTTSYDVGVQVTPVRFRDEAGAAVSWMSYSVVSGTDFTDTYPASPPAWALTGLPKMYTNTTALFPFAAGYSVYAGNCAGNAPQLYDPSFATRGARFAETTVVPEPGQAAQATALLRSVDVSVTRNTTTGADVYVYFKPAASVMPMQRPAGEHPCDEVVGPIVVPGVGVAAKTVSISLPYGIWSVCADDTVRYRYRSAAVNAYYNTPSEGTPAPTPDGSYPLLDVRGATTTSPTAAAHTSGGNGTCATRAW